VSALLASVLLARASGTPWAERDGEDLVAFQDDGTLPVVGALLALASAFAAIRRWRWRAGTFGARVRCGATVVLALLFTWSLHVWNLLGWRM
jgi:uncharacterized membrane protein YdbT with pleckstrin-like domain